MGGKNRFRLFASMACHASFISLVQILVLQPCNANYANPCTYQVPSTQENHLDLPARYDWYLALLDAYAKQQKRENKTVK